MTTNTHAIAAFIAANTPIRSTYQAAFLASERELGERIGYPALVYGGTPSAGRIKTDWDGVVFFDPIGIDGMTLTEALTNYAEHNDEHEDALPCHCDYCQVWIPMAHKVESDSAAKDNTIAGLREALATAEEHIGALLDLPHMPESITTLIDARAWLRRA
jgi:hypothetical protein